MYLRDVARFLSPAGSTAIRTVVALCVAPAVHGQAPTPPQPQGALTVGPSEVRELAAGAVHAWRLQLGAGEYIELTVQQLGADVQVRVLAPGGESRADVNDRLAGTPELPKWIADTTGEWTVIVAHTGRGRDGSYEVAWTTRRAATAADVELVLADSLARAGRQLGERGAHAASDSLLLRSLEIRERVLGRDHLEVASTLIGLSVNAANMGRTADAEQLVRRALGIREAQLSPDDPDIAGALNNLAVFQHRQMRFAEAEASYRRILAIQERAPDPDPLPVARTLINLGWLFAGQQRAAEADSMYQRALPILEAELGPDDVQVARVLYGIATVRNGQGRYADAEPLYRRALAIHEGAQGVDHPDVAWSLNALGWNLYRQARFREAEELYRRGLAVWEARGLASHPGAGVILQNLANLFGGQARYTEAETLHRRALSILESANGPDHIDVAASLNDLAVLYSRMYRYEEAEALYRRAHAIQLKAHGPENRHVANALNNIGVLYVDQGRYAEAEPLHQRAVEIGERVLGPEHPDFGNFLNNLGLLYNNQGRYADAEPIIRRAVEIRERALGPSHANLAVNLRNLGNVYVNLSRHGEAEAAYRRALAIEENARGPESLGAARTLGMLAELLSGQERYDEAEPLHRRAIAAAEMTGGADHPGLSGMLTELAETLWSRGRDRAEARALVDRALAIRDRHTLHPQTQINALTLRARLLREAGDTARAITELGQAIRVAEERRPQIGGGEETRAAFFSRYTEMYDLMIRWQLEAGRIDAAFEYAERGRARVLLDQLAAGKIDLRAGIPPDVREPLVARETDARARMAEYQERIARLRSRNDLEQDERDREQQQLADSLRAAENEFRAIYEEIKNASPLWRDLITSGGQPITLATAQSRMVPDGGFLLLYQIGDEESFLFLIPPGSATPEVMRLAIAAEEARTLGVAAGALTAASLERVLLGDREQGTTAVADSGLAIILGNAPARGIGVRGDRERTSLEQLHALWRVLVPDTVWGRLRSAAQVVLVPGRGLHVLPFEALVVEKAPRAADARFWLDEGPAIRYGASASTLYNLDHRAATRLLPVGMRETVVSLSDPVFDAAAARAEPRPVIALGGEADAGVTRSSFLTLGGSLARLPGTAAETDAIRQAFSGSTFSVVALQRSEATESRLRPALTGPRYLHLATHGLVDEQRGALFAALALTPPPVAGVDDDGFLQLHEIYQLRLPELELAVLSACETNVGTTIMGEGVFALSRGFLAAGARRVIASQWAVDDRSTAELIGHFFGGIAADENAGRVIDYAGALRAAKRSVRQNDAWAHPYFWAPFVLTGRR